MPNLSAHFSDEVKSFYNFSFSEDGYPCQKRADGSLFEHPIYPIYIINDYIKQMKAKPKNPAVRAAILTIVDALTRRMETRGSLTFMMYDKGADVGRAHAKHPSGLTQAYYADLFSRLSRLFPNDSRLAATACSFYESVFSPVEKGGVARSWGAGIGIEEVPLEHPDLVLNGWLSALKAMMDAADRGRGWGRDPRIHANLDLLEALLPQYDHPDTQNSRYSLAGPVSFRLKRSAGSHPVILRAPRVDYGDGFETFAPGGIGGWTNTIELDANDSGTAPAALEVAESLKLSFVWSRVHTKNELAIETCEGSGSLDIEVLVGDYSPLSAGPVNRHWHFVRKITSEEAGHLIRIVPPREATNLIGYPTNFLKKFGDTRRNVYHAIHINRLWQLAKKSDREAFKTYAKLWTEYALSWKNSSMYSGLQIEPIEKRIPRDLLKAVGHTVSSAR